jgi:hypothetical protein
MSDTTEQEFTEWMESGKYLPPVLRDFHDQKDFFKFIDMKVGKRREKEAAGGHPDTYLDGYNWVMLHVLTIDFVLWFLALHGYTLQRSRRRFPFRQWSALDKEAREYWFAKCEKVWPLLPKAAAQHPASSPLEAPGAEGGQV